jgi:hypothetical protein
MQQAEMQPILIDRGQFAAQTLVEIIDDFGVALHDALQFNTAENGQICWSVSEADLEP